MATAFPLLVIALALAPGAGFNLPAASPADEEVRLDVPYLPQTPALCGGAAAAMVFRYWGDRHAGVEQFARYVDPHAGGIADDVLVDAIQERQWQAERISGSVEDIRARLAAREPIILLLADRPGRYHYVVAVGADSQHVYIHDPTWGPSRRLTNDDLIRQWKPSGFRSLVVRPSRSNTPDAVSASTRTRPATECDRFLDEAVDEIGRRGLASADQVLDDVRRRCPRAAGPVAELAGVRFAQQRLDEAETLARQALQIDSTHGYAWDVLGSTRFMRNDTLGALRAWNHIGKPRVDSIQIEGLRRTRYTLVADSLRLSPNKVLTEPAYRAAQRRLGELPGSLTTGMRYRPEEDGFTTVHVALLERRARPQGLAAWLAAGARAAATREVRTTVPGWSGQGETWSAAWRWWNERPRVALSFAAPRAFGFPGVTRVDASWEQQTYRFAGKDAAIRETELHGGLAFTDWLTANLRYELSVGLQSWDHTKRTVSTGVAVEQSILDDHLTLTASSHFWNPVSSSTTPSLTPFRSGSIGATVRSSRELRGMVHTMDVGADIASRSAPLARWSGAGEGHARAPLLRAHPLLAEGVIAGSTFGRRTLHATAETTRWIQRVPVANVGVAAFIDLARSTHGMRSDPLQALADLGAGLRVALPGSDGVLRVDYAHGVRDGQDAVSVGWLFTRRR